MQASTSECVQCVDARQTSSEIIGNEVVCVGSHGHGHGKQKGIVTIICSDCDVLLLQGQHASALTGPLNGLINYCSQIRFINI